VLLIFLQRQVRRLLDLITLLHGELLVLRLRTIVTFRSCAAVAFASGLHTFLEILLATVIALVVSAIAAVILVIVTIIVVVIIIAALAAIVLVDCLPLLLLLLAIFLAQLVLPAFAVVPIDLPLAFFATTRVVSLEVRLITTAAVGLGGALVLWPILADFVVVAVFALFVAVIDLDFFLT